jgi:autotransporter translocation and assembly factor TamB
MRKALRVVRVVATVLLLLITVPLALVHLALLTAPAREWVRATVERLADDAVPGELRIGQLHTLSIVHVRVSGIELHDLQHKKVASVGDISVYLNPLALVLMRLDVVSLKIQQPYADLGDPQGEGGGLLGLLDSQPPAPPEPEPSEPSSFVIELRKLQIDRGQVEVRANGAHFKVQDFNTLVRGQLGPDLALGVDRLRTGVLRDGRRVAIIRGQDLGYTGQGQMRARLAIDAGETAITATAALEPSDASGSQPMQAQLSARRISPATLASFGVQTDVLTAPIDLDVDAKGTLSALAVHAKLTTPGGAVLIDANRQGNALEATIRTQDLKPHAFLRPEIAPVSAVLHARATDDPDKQITDLGLELEPGGAYGGTPLPALEVRAQRNAAGGVRLERLQARYANAELNATGRLEPSGGLTLAAKLQASSLAELAPVKKADLDLGGELDADVHFAREPSGAFTANTALNLKRGHFGETQAEIVQLKVDAHGPSFDRPSLVLELHSAALRVGGTQLPRADLTVAGGPQRYFVAGRFSDRGGVRITVARDGERISVDGVASVSIDQKGKRRPLRAKIGRVDYDPEQGLAVRDVELTFHGASAKIDGTLDARQRASIAARIRAPNLEGLTEPWMQPAIKGSLAATAELGGSLQKPRLRADVHYRSQEMFGVQNIAVDIAALGDFPRKLVTLELDSSSSAGGVDVNLKSALRSSAPSAAAFTGGSHELKVRFDRLRPSDVTLWPRGKFVPIRAVLSGEVSGQGTLKDLEVATDLDARLVFGADSGTLDLALKGGYGGEKLDLKLEASDQQGPLLRTKLQTEVTRQRFSRDPDAIQRFLRERSWEANIWVGARRVEELPLARALDIPEAVWPARVSAQLDLKHMPGQEPDGTAQVKAAWEPAAQAANKQQIASVPAAKARCGTTRNPKLELNVRMRDGELHSELLATLEGKPALQLETESHAPLDEWLRPEPSKIRPAGAALRFSDLELSDLPLACEFVDGHVSGFAEIRRALTKDVKASAELQGKQIRFGEAPAIDAKITAGGDQRGVNTKIELKGPKGSGLLSAKVPLDARGRMPSVSLEAPFFAQAQFRNMDVRSLLGPVPDVRATAGELDTDLTVSGTLIDPRVQGTIGLRDVTVTLAQVGQRLERVSGTLALNGRSVRIERLRVHDRDGKADITGQLTMRGLGSFKGDIKAKANDFPVRNTGVMLATFDGTAALTADIDEQHSQFGLTLHEARIELTDEDPGGVQSLKTNPELVFIDEGERDVEEVEETAKTPLVFDIDASEPFWVTRSDFSVLVSTKMKLEATEGPVSVTGTVDIARGYIELIGQSFDIERGHIEFTGGHEVEPTLDLVAIKRAPGGSKVTIKATGTLKEPQLAFFVDDEAVTAGEALAAASGSRSSGSDSTVQQQMSSMATGLAAGLLTLGARREIGEWMPVLSIDAGENGPSVRAGVQADRFIPKFLRGVVLDAYVEGILSAEEQGEGQSSNDSSGSAMPAALMELRFPHDLVGEAQYGPGERFSIDLGWEP